MASEPKYTIIGTPFSTYTRSITLGLTYKGIAFDQVRCTPHSDTAEVHHPFGFLPTLVVREGGREWRLRESQAIARYVDRVRPTPSLARDACAGGVAERVWEFASMAGAHGFPAIEKGVVKPLVAALDGGLPVAAIHAATAPGLPGLRHFLAQIEAEMVPTPLDAYAFGAQVTWADFFLFPLLADLKAVEGQLEAPVLSERLKAWMGRMEQLEAVQKTTPGTLSAGARPP